MFALPCFMSRSLHSFPTVEQTQRCAKAAFISYLLEWGTRQNWTVLLIMGLLICKFCHAVMSQLAPFVMIYMVRFHLKSETFAKLTGLRYCYELNLANWSSCNSFTFVSSIPMSISFSWSVLGGHLWTNGLTYIQCTKYQSSPEVSLYGKWVSADCSWWHHLHKSQKNILHSQSLS